MISIDPFSFLSSFLSSFPSSSRRSSRLAVALCVSLTMPMAAGCGSDATLPSTTDVPTAIAGLAVISSDYQKTSVSLVDPASQTVTDCLSSAGTRSGVPMEQPLSGDVTLPSQAQPGAELIVIDRKNAVLTFVDPGTCAPRSQLSVSTGGLMANPRDVIRLSGHKAYVTRYSKNGAPTDDPGDFDEGDDILVIDPLATEPGQTPILKRIALSEYATQVPGAAILARPDRGVLVNGKVYLTLGNLDETFSTAGAGRVVVIDSVTDAVVEVIDLPHQQGCSAIDHVAATNHLYVSCGGGPFGDPHPAATAALVEIDLSGDKPALGRSVLASAVGGVPLNFSFAAALGDNALVVTLGSLDPTTGSMTAPDVLVSVGLGTGVMTKLREGGAYQFGRAAVDPGRKKLFLPDANPTTPRVQVFQMMGAELVPTGSLDADPTAHLPPREIGWY